MSKSFGHLLKMQIIVVAWNERSAGVTKDSTVCAKSALIRFWMCIFTLNNDLTIMVWLIILSTFLKRNQESRDYLFTSRHSASLRYFQSFSGCWKDSQRIWFGFLPEGSGYFQGSSLAFAGPCPIGSRLCWIVMLQQEKKIIL